MFKELKYQWRTKDLFNPRSNVNVSQDQFLQILRGEVINPNMLPFSRRDGDYPFMVVGVPEDNLLNSWAGKEFGLEGYKKAHDRVSWYARVSCEGESRVVFPSRNLFFNFDFHTKKSEKKSYLTKHDLNFVLFGSDSHHVDKSLKVLVSDLPEEKVLKYVGDYESLFSSRSVYLH